MTPAELDEIEAVARPAAALHPDGWEEVESGSVWGKGAGKGWVADVTGPEAVSAFIARMDPATTLRLVAAVREAHKGLRAIEWEGEVRHGEPRICPGCGTAESDGHHSHGCPVGEPLCGPFFCDAHGAKEQDCERCRLAAALGRGK